MPPQQVGFASTPIGRACQAYYAELPFWTLFNLVLALLLAPSGIAWYFGKPLMAFTILLLPVWFYSGMAKAAWRTLHRGAPRYRDLVQGSWLATLSTWLIVAIAGVGIRAAPSPEVLGASYVLAVVALMPLPFLLCTGHLGTTAADRARAALLLTLHYPVASLGLLALVMFSVQLAVALHGALLLVLPAVWILIACHATHELMTQIAPKSRLQTHSSLYPHPAQERASDEKPLR
jgi:hypothetical protein